MMFFTPAPICPTKSPDDVFHTSTDLSDKISKDLKRRGMKFVGTTIIYSFLQAVGVVNDHELACFCHPSHAE